MDRDLKDALDASLEPVMTGLQEHRDGIERRLDDLQNQLDQFGLRGNRPLGGGHSGGSEEQRAFMAYCRSGIESKALSSGDDAAGGYLAPAEFVAELDKDLIEFSPVRAAARVGQTTRGSVMLPKRTTAPVATWVSETGTRTETSPAYGLDEIVAQEMATFVDISNQLLDDSAIDLEAEIRSDLAEAFGKLEGTAFVLGDGVGKPEGILSTSANVTQVSTGNATLVTADSLRTVLYGLPGFYRRRSTWMMNGTTLGNIAKLKDGNGQYLWRPGLREEDPDTLLGRPIIEATDMPDEAAGALAVALGDFQRYRIYDRIQMAILRDPYTNATTGQTRFHARRRVGGLVRLSEAFRLLICQA